MGIHMSDDNNEIEQAPAAPPDPIVVITLQPPPGIPFKNEFGGEVTARLPKSKVMDFFNEITRQLQSQVGFHMQPPKMVKKIEMKVDENGEVKVQKIVREEK